MVLLRTSPPHVNHEVGDSPLSMIQADQRTRITVSGVDTFTRFYWSRTMGYAALEAHSPVGRSQSYDQTEATRFLGHEFIFCHRRTFRFRCGRPSAYCHAARSICHRLARSSAVRTMVGPAPTEQGVSFPKGAPREKGFVALGCKCTCQVCGPLFFKSLDLINKHRVGQRAREPRAKRARLTKDDTCLCYSTKLLDIPRDPNEKEKLLRDHCFFYTCKKNGRGQAPTYSRGLSLFDIEVRASVLHVSSIARFHGMFCP